MATIDTITSTALPAVNVAAAGKAYFLTDNNKFVVNTGSRWVEVHSDGTGAVPFSNRWAVKFDNTAANGNSQHIDIDASSYDLSGDFGLSFWVNMTSDRWATNGIIGMGYDTSGANGWRLYRQNTNVFKLWTKDSSESYANPLNGGTPLLNTWYHVVLTRSGSTLTLYMNGNSEATGTSSHDFSGSVLKIGDNYVWDGLFDDFAIFESALDQTAVTALYGGGTPSEVTGAAGYWRFGDVDSATSGGNIVTITDSSGNGNAATQSTLTDQPEFKELDPPRVSLDFDNNDYLDLAIGASDLQNDLTFSGWFKIAEAEQGPLFYDNYESNSSAPYGYRIWKYGANHIHNGKIDMYLRDGTYPLAFITDSAVVPDDVWFHLAITRTSNTFKVYIDGVEKNVTQGTATERNLGANGTVQLLATHGGDHALGKADEVAMFSSALTQSEIASLAASRGAHIVDDLSLSPASYYRMGEDNSLADGDAVTGIDDASGNGNNATTVATNQPTASVESSIYVAS